MGKSQLVLLEIPAHSTAGMFSTAFEAAENSLRAPLLITCQSNSKHVV